MDDARGFGRDQSFEGDGGEQVGLRELAFDQRSPDVQDRLALVDDGAFGDGEDVAGEAEIGEVIPEAGGCVAEVGQAPKVGDFVRFEAEVQQVVEGPVEPGGEHEIAIARQPPDGEFEGPDLFVFPGREVARGHGEFVEVGQKGVQVISSCPVSGPGRA